MQVALPAVAQDHNQDQVRVALHQDLGRLGFPALNANYGQDKTKFSKGQEVVC